MTRTKACQILGIAIDADMIVHVPDSSALQIMDSIKAFSPMTRIHMYLHTISEPQLLSVIFWTVSPVKNLPKKVY